MCVDKMCMNNSKMAAYFWCDKFENNEFKSDKFNL